jgi:hypothetical protein
MKLLHFFFIVKTACLETPKYCVNCKHFKSQFLFNTEFGKCKLFPIIKKDENFLVTGKVKKEGPDYQYCSVVRVYEDKCGEEGKLYKNKNGARN